MGQGAVVVEVARDSPADKAGLRAGDVIVAVNGRSIRGSADVRNQVGLIPVGEEVEFRLFRDGRIVVLKARVEKPRAS
jgi:S1-C subfamily serine protease